MSDPLDMNNYRLEKLPKMQKSGFEIWMARLGGPCCRPGSAVVLLFRVLDRRRQGALVLVGVGLRRGRALVQHQ